ncbi:hypothetical protein ERJ70_15930 [Sediminibacillus dalangtanensis]|uniref:Tumour necrosis factor receptor superfamily member 19 n=1 Tax=Sediminibacillus dalangtanensis TaxID=2729421 RepID=A0ABX7W0H2_9BACI|nr:hypothetical protein [Sediminibacillus dalangtanensis]QTN00647.1 hypothetical protein ERJ70_15930 [Sediminibacillus dalangtanensis]
MGLVAIITYVISLFILYVVIETAVKNGINKSNVGRHFDMDRLEEPEDTKKSLFDTDLDKD